MSGGAVGSGPDRDWHSIGAGLSQLANLIDEAKKLSVLGIQNSGGGSPVQSIENLGTRLCASLDNLSRHLDVAAKTLDRFIDATECLPASETPIVFVEEKTGQARGSPSLSTQENRD
jgi:hypothetical protein